MKINRRVYLTCFITLFTLLSSTFLYFGVDKAFAQNENPDWSPPINLSQSGGTSFPSIVVDSQEFIHVIWQDEFAGHGYAVFDGNTWSQPVTMVLPFVDRLPKLIPGREGNIYAFWQDETNALQSTTIPVESITYQAAWNTSRRVAESASQFDVVMDDNNDLHLAYIRPIDTIEFPAGIYYRRSSDGGVTWSNGILLGQSRYFRAIDTEKLNISIDVSTQSESTTVIVGWDIPARRRIYMNISRDSGQTWNGPEEVDQPNEELRTSIPYHIQVTAQAETLMLTWQKGSPAGSCHYYYQISKNGGSTWEKKKRMLTNIQACAQQRSFIKGNDDLILLQNSMLDQVYMMVWNGSAWSDPQRQPDLIGFEDPDSFSWVSYSSRQYVIRVADDRIYSVGAANSDNQDIWLISRVIGETSIWFPPHQIWSSPTLINSSQTKPGKMSLELGLGGEFYAMWAQSTEEMGDNGTYLVMATGSEDNLIQTTKLSDLNINNASRPAIFLDHHGNLNLSVEDKQTGSIFFREASIGQSDLLEWSEPKLVPSPGKPAQSAEILVDQNNVIHVVYVIPLNDYRGVYFTSSKDNGKNWSEPSLIFDGRANNWEMVTSPHFTITPENHIHVIWNKAHIPGGLGNQGTYYAYSTDEGETWSEALLVVDGDVVWGKIVSLADGSLHRLWLEEEYGYGNLRHQISWDLGRKWEPVPTISQFGAEISLPVLVADMTGRMHLIRLNYEQTNIQISHLVWQNLKWQSMESQILDIDSNFIVETISASARNNILAVLYTVAQPLTEAGQRYATYITRRSIGDAQLPQVTSTPVPTQTVPEELVEEQVPNPTSTSNPTPTLAIPIVSGSETTPRNDRSLPVILGSLFTAGSILIVIISYFYLQNIKRNS